MVTTIFITPSILKLVVYSLYKLLGYLTVYKCSSYILIFHVRLLVLTFHKVKVNVPKQLHNRKNKKLENEDMQMYEKMFSVI